MTKPADKSTQGLDITQPLLPRYVQQENRREAATEETDDVAVQLETDPHEVDRGEAKKLIRVWLHTDFDSMIASFDENLQFVSTCLLLVSGILYSSLGACFSLRVVLLRSDGRRGTLA